MERPAILAEDVSKRFVTHRRRATSLKELFVQRGSVTEDFWALREVTTAIGHGETVGLIGPNGSGKSTLLKVLAGILQPSTGRVTIGGRIASLLELGAGFNGELSGRDNVYLNASLLGLSKREVDKLYDSIVDFAELGGRMDDAVKHYSSGMYVRLGFAVAVHVDPDILLVDEVLAVGDEAFQQKCLAKIDAFQREGRTILFVSHDLGLVERLCSRAIVLHRGRMMHDGDANEGSRVLRGLLGTVGDSGPQAADGLDAKIEIVGLTITDHPGGEPRDAFLPGEPLAVRVALRPEPGGAERTVDVKAVVMGPFDIPVFVMSSQERGGVRLGDAPSYDVDFVVPELPPLLGGFVVSVGVTDAATGVPLAARRFDEVFQLKGNHEHGLVDVAFDVRSAPSEVTDRS